MGGALYADVGRLIIRDGNGTGGGGRLFIGTVTDSGALLQIGTNTTTSAGGIALGTDTFIYRTAGGNVSIGSPSGNGVINLLNSGTAPSFIQSPGTGGLYLQTNGLDAIFINSSQNATFAGTVKTKGSTLSAINETNVSTTATDIAIATSVGSLYFVTGYNTSGGAQGTWLLMARGANVTTISSDNNTGLTVTYSMSAGKLQAATASGTIALIATAITR